MWRIAISIPPAQGICIVIVMTWNVRDVNCNAGTGYQEAEFFEKRARGINVENNLFDAASAVVLSESVGMRMGILEPGKN